MPPTLSTALLKLVLEILPQLCCPSLSLLQPLNFFLVVSGPKLDTRLKFWSHQCLVQGDSLCPCHADCIIADTSQDATGILVYLGTAGLCSATVNQQPQVLFHQEKVDVLQPLCLQACSSAWDFWDLRTRLSLSLTYWSSFNWPQPTN